MAEELNMEGEEQVVNQKDSGETPADSNGAEDGEESAEAFEEDTDWSEEETSPIDEAIQALEQLSRAVSMLFQQQPDALNDLGAKLRQVADMVSSAVVGNKPVATEPHQKPENDLNLPRASEDPMKALDSLRREISAINARLNALMQKEVKAQPRAKEKEQPRMDQLAELTKAFSSLTSMFQSHQQRLTRMEKSYGLPNSLSGDEGAQPEMGRSWPLDLNSSGF